MQKLKDLYNSPKVRQYALLAATYAAGAYGGPLAANAVQAHGPAILKGISLLFGG